MRFLAAGLLAAASLARAQVVPQPTTSGGLTVFRPPGDAGLTVSYKEPKDICTTSKNTQKQYTGWVNIPGKNQANVFFWFVEAREPTESLTVWLQGGPGGSSMYSFWSENGPCQLVEKGRDKYETIAREWGWDGASNMLFIDQPNHVGFSYDTPTNGTMGLDLQIQIPPNRDASGWARMDGVFSSAKPEASPRTSKEAAMAVWHTMQGFLATFPHYQPSADADAALSLFGQSYAGFFMPIFAEVWESQNQKRLTGELNRDTTAELRLTSVGIVNGWVDQLTQTPAFPEFASTNTYGIKALTDEQARADLDKFATNTTCRDLLNSCHNLDAQLAPETYRTPEVDKVCAQAVQECYYMEATYLGSGHGTYDIAADTADPQPPPEFAEFLNQAKVLEALGSPVNFTHFSYASYLNFIAGGDVARGGNIKRLAGLLQRGIRVGLVYGDRDYICNWIGGEAVSKAIAAETGGDYAAKFPEAGYAPIQLGDGSRVGGSVRQYGNLSFSRVYQSGHQVGWYQPEMSFKTFSRIITGAAVSDGRHADIPSTSGPLQDTHRDEAPKAAKPKCFIRSFDATCNAEAQALRKSGSGVVINGKLYSKEEDWSP